MSERTQHTSFAMREKMARRYGNIHHKHDKRHHLDYRLHCRSHPNKMLQIEEHLGGIKSPSSGLKAPLKEKMWKRLAKTPFH